MNIFVDFSPSISCTLLDNIKQIHTHLISSSSWKMDQTYNLRLRISLPLNYQYNPAIASNKSCCERLLAILKKDELQHGLPQLPVSIVKTSTIKMLVGV